MHLIQLTTLPPAQAMETLSRLLCGWQPATVKMHPDFRAINMWGKKTVKGASQSFILQARKQEYGAET